MLVDRTQPTGSVTAPASGATVGGPAVALGATAADTAGSGVALVEWQVKNSGAAASTPSPATALRRTTGAGTRPGRADGATEIRAVITDAAGNARTTAAIPVTVDSTGPSVTLTDPGAVVSGTVALDRDDGRRRRSRPFGVRPADAGTWTQIA